MFSGGTKRIFFAVALPLAAPVALGACANDAGTTTYLIRGADDIQVMTPDEVAAARNNLTGANANASNTATTIPLNEDNRPPEVKLFAAYQKFNECIKADGYKIEGNLQDPNNPALKDPDYVASLTKCAARSDILGALRASQEAQAKLTPDEVQKRNENFKKISDCLKKRGWTVETTVGSNGIVQPKVFTSPDGGINERDVDQCVTETGINTE